jgi:hypothetical protein
VSRTPAGSRDVESPSARHAPTRALLIDVSSGHGAWATMISAHSWYIQSPDQFAKLWSEVYSEGWQMVQRRPEIARRLQEEN